MSKPTVLVAGAHAATARVPRQTNMANRVVVVFGFFMGHTIPTLIIWYADKRRRMIVAETVAIRYTQCHDFRMWDEE